jgi:hypothetical protein
MDQRDLDGWLMICFLVAGLFCGAVALFNAGSRQDALPASILGAGFFLGFAHLRASRR